MPRHHPARWWERLDDGVIHCFLCPRNCRIREGHAGFCQVRRVENGELVSLVHGRTSGFRVDPVEKKPLYHFLPGSETLSFGTACCNMGCIFCQNWHMSRAQPDEILNMEATADDIAAAALDNGCQSVSFTYNDPVVFAEYTAETAEACHRQGLKTIAVTAGYVGPEARADFFSGIDATNIDLKGFTEDFYRKFCQASLAPVLETLEYVARDTKVWLEVTNLVIPEANDSPDDIDAMTKWMRDHLGPDVPLFFSAFHPDFRLADRGPTSPETLVRARDTAMKNGLRYVYTGNLGRWANNSTYCHACGTRVVERQGFRVLQSDLAAGCCPSCNTRIPGVFAEKALASEG